MSKMMMRRAAASGLVSANIFALRRGTRRQIPAIARHISLWRSRASRDAARQDLPVYFPRQESKLRSWISHSRGRILRTAVAFLVVYACYEIYKEIVLVPLLAWADEEYESLSEKEKDELDKMSDEDPGLFLPCPFTERQVEQPPYKQSDPEWPFLMKARDPKIQQQLSEEICRVVVRYCSSHPHFRQFFGSDKNLKIGRVWLDFAIPARPPAKPYISGLILDDEGIFWGERPIDPKSSTLLNKAMYPKSMALAGRDFCYAMYVILRDDVRRYFGMAPKGPPQRGPRPMVVAMPRQQQSGGGGSGSTVVTARATRQNGALSFPEGQDNMSNRFRLAFAYAAARFLRSRQVRQPVRRGCFELEGVASIESKTKAATVAIHAWYDPQQRKFVDAWIVPKRWGSKPR